MTGRHPYLKRPTLHILGIVGAVPDDEIMKGELARSNKVSSTDT